VNGFGLFCLIKVNKPLSNTLEIRITSGKMGRIDRTKISSQPY